MGGCLLEFFSVAGGGAAGDLLLEIVVQILVRIQLGRVWRQVVDGDRFGMCLHQDFHVLRFVDAQDVKDEHHLAARILAQPLEERQQRRCINGLLEHHVAEQAGIADRGQLAHRLPLREHRSDGRDPLGRTHAPARVARAETRFVAPVDLRALSRSLALDSRILGVEPLGDGLGALLVRALDWLLRGEPLARDVMPDGAHVQHDVVLPLDKLADGGARPARKLQLRLIRRRIGDRPLQGLPLLRRQSAMRPVRRATLLRHEDL